MKLWKKLFFTLSTMLILVFCMSSPVHAFAKPVCAKSVTCYLYDSGKSEEVVWFPTIYSSSIFIKNLSSDAKITNIKSSNKLIKGTAGNTATYKTSPSVNLSVNYKTGQTVKPGDKTTISFKVKQNGKTYSLKCKIKYKKAPSPAASFKIGQKDVASSFAGSDLARVRANGVMTLSYTSAKGYKIIEVRAYSNSGPSAYPKGTVIKNGGKIDTNKYYALRVYYKTLNPPKYHVEAKNMGLIGSNLKDYVDVSFIK